MEKNLRYLSQSEPPRVDVEASAANEGALDKRFLWSKPMDFSVQSIDTFYFVVARVDQQTAA